MNLHARFRMTLSCVGCPAELRSFQLCRTGLAASQNPAESDGKRNSGNLELLKPYIREIANKQLSSPHQRSKAEETSSYNRYIHCFL